MSTMCVGAFVGRSRRFLVGAMMASILVCTYGCGPTGYIVGGVAGATAIGSYFPTQEIEQIYYLGSFDPQGQLPNEFYRVIVRGQASLISRMDFGSGWVQSDLMDSLGTTIRVDKSGLQIQRASGLEPGEGFKTGRRLVLFGPEGFRESPRDHRLVIVMGASPEEFFKAIDTSLGAIADVQQVQSEAFASRELFEEYVQLTNEMQRLQELRLDVEANMPAESAQ